MATKEDKTPEFLMATISSCWFTFLSLSLSLFFLNLFLVSSFCPFLIIIIMIIIIFIRITCNIIQNKGYKIRKITYRNGHFFFLHDIMQAAQDEWMGLGKPKTQDAHCSLILYMKILSKDVRLVPSRTKERTIDPKMKDPWSINVKQKAVLWA